MRLGSLIVSALLLLSAGISPCVRAEVQQVHGNQFQLREIHCLGDAAADLAWLGDVYAHAKTYEEFESGAGRVAERVASATAQVSRPDDLAIEPAVAGDEANVVLAAVRELEAKSDNAGQQQADKPVSPDENTTRLREEAAVMAIQFAKRADLLPDCRAAVLRAIGTKLSVQDFIGFREAVFFELIRIVPKERVYYWGHVGDFELGQPPVIANVMAKLATTQDDAPDEEFGSLLQGLFDASVQQDRQNANAEGARQQVVIREAALDLLGMLPLDRDGHPTALIKLAMGDDPNDRAVNLEKNEGFIWMLWGLPRDETIKDGMRNRAKVCLGETVSNWHFEKLEQRIDNLARRVLSLEKRADTLEARLTALEARVSRLETEVKYLWEAIRQNREFTARMVALRSDRRKVIGSKCATPGHPSQSGLSVDDETELLQNLAPVLLFDAGRHLPSICQPNPDDTETIASPAWFVGNLARRLGGAPAQPDPHGGLSVDPNQGDNNKLLAQLVGELNAAGNPGDLHLAGVSKHSSGFPERAGPAGDRQTSLTQAAQQPCGIFGLVQRIDEEIYSVQYYVFLPFNAATHGNWNHGGDWLCIDLTVTLISVGGAPDVKHPILLLAYYHNHGPVIEIESYALEAEDGHVKAYVEFGCNEPEPRAGGQGDRHTNLPGIRRNRRIHNFGKLGGHWANEEFEYWSVRPHFGDGVVVRTWGAVKNVRSDDPESAFVRAFSGKWGSDGDSPQSPYWNGTMVGRNFGF